MSISLLISGLGCGASESSGNEGTDHDAAVSAETDAAVPTDPDAPQIQAWQASLTRMEESGSVTFSAVVTDPQGSADILGGSVIGSSNASYGSLVKVAEGRYELTTSWDAINATEAITGRVEGVVRTFKAQVFDTAGHSGVATLDITLGCSDGGFAPCDGECEWVEVDPHSCGGCGLICPGASSDPLSSHSYCQNSLCQEVYLTFPERMSCAEACATYSATCDHDDQCPGGACDLHEQSWATYGDYSVPLADCDAAPPGSYEGVPFEQLGCTCKDLPAM